MSLCAGVVGHIYTQTLVYLEYIPSGGRERAIKREREREREDVSERA